MKLTIAIDVRPKKATNAAWSLREFNVEQSTIMKCYAQAFADADSAGWETKGSGYIKARPISKK